MSIKLKVNYFAHDYGARYNPKLIALQMAMGALGLAIFWCLIEMLWENVGYYPCVYETISFQLRWATADDVRRVVEEFDLFRTDGERFWNDCVLERMEIRNNISEKRAKSGQEGGLQSGVSRREKAIASRTGTIAKANASDTESNRNSGALSKETNDIKRVIYTESQYHTEEEEKKMIFEVFFWANYLSPAYEADRFWEHYAKTGWTTSDGVAIQDKEKVAKFWKAEKKGKRFNPEFLTWYKSIVLAAKNHLETNVIDKFLSGLVRVILNGKDMTITYSSRELAEQVAAFVCDNKLYCGYKIEWKFEN